MTPEMLQRLQGGLGQAGGSSGEQQGGDVDVQLLRRFCSLAERLKNWSREFFILSPVISDLTCVFSGVLQVSFTLRLCLGQALEHQ